MKKLFCLVLLVGVVLAGAGCREFREYTVENNKLGGQGIYYDLETRSQFDKVQDVVGPKSIYY